MPRHTKTSVEELLCLDSLPPCGVEMPVWWKPLQVQTPALIPKPFAPQTRCKDHSIIRPRLEWRVRDALAAPKGRARGEVSLSAAGELGDVGLGGVVRTWSRVSKHQPWEAEDLLTLLAEKF